MQDRFLYFVINIASETAQNDNFGQTNCAVTLPEVVQEEQLQLIKGNAYKGLY